MILSKSSSLLLFWALNLPVDVSYLFIFFFLHFNVFILFEGCVYPALQGPWGDIRAGLGSTMWCLECRLVNKTYQMFYRKRLKKKCISISQNGPNISKHWIHKENGVMGFRMFRMYVHIYCIMFSMYVI